MLINIVITKDLNSRILYDIFQRFIERTSDCRFVVTEQPLHDADVYHYHRAHLESSILGPAVMTVHHDPNDIDPWVHFEKFRRHYLAADAVICLNSLQAAFLASEGIDHTVTIPHGYDHKIFSMKPIKPFSPNRKICLGIVSKRYDRRVKGEVFLFELLQRLPPERVSLLFVGEGRNQDASAARRLGYEVECHEFLPYRLFPSLYQGMDFLLMLSNFEGGPANLPEAVGTGTPVICTRIGMVADMVRDSENGIVLTGDVDSDADRMASILSNEGGIYDRLATNAQLVRTAPTWDDVVDRHLALYRDIVQRRQDGRKPRLEAEKQLLAA